MSHRRERKGGSRAGRSSIAPPVVSYLPSRTTRQSKSSLMQGRLLGQPLKERVPGPAERGRGREPTRGRSPRRGTGKKKAASPEVKAKPAPPEAKAKPAPSREVAAPKPKKRAAPVCVEALSEGTGASSALGAVKTKPAKNESWWNLQGQVRKGLVLPPPLRYLGQGRRLRGRAPWSERFLRLRRSRESRSGEVSEV